MFVVVDNLADSVVPMALELHFAHSVAFAMQPELAISEPILKIFEIQSRFEADFVCYLPARLGSFIAIPWTFSSWKGSESERRC